MQDCTKSGLLAESRSPGECRFVLESLREVCRCKTEIKRRGLVPEERLRLHQKHVQSVTASLRSWFEAQFAERNLEPNSRLEEAISYCVKTW